MFIDNKKIAYIDEGSGQAIVLMHGIPTNSWMFRKIIPMLVTSGYRVIVPDLLGMGQSEKVKDKNQLVVASQARIMMKLITEKLQLPVWKHVVHDFGGPITWEMMEDPRFNVSEFIFLNTPLFKKGFNSGLNIFSRAFTSLGTTGKMKKIFYTAAIQGMVSDEKLLSSKMKEGYLEPLLNGASKAYKCLYFSVNDVRSQFSRYQENTLLLKNVPVKVIWGEKDRFLDSKIQVRQIRDHLDLEDKDITILKGARHIITEEAPDKIVEIIIK